MYLSNSQGIREQAVTPTYRADIDGLRAIAVLSVVLFHAGVEAFGGGFVGVDIFFVISGYLITTIIHREVEEGRFSIARFYERRFRRILPAAAVMIITVLVGGELLFPLHHQDSLARSAIAATLFSSNIYFFLESGYFADPAHSMPLLHTWSLAVEEQFYLELPVVMLLIAKHGGRGYRSWLTLLTIVSLAACVVLTESNASAAFYLGHTRAWELLAGGLLAVKAIPALQDQRSREIVSLAGLLLLSLSVLYFSELTVFPGLAALLPVLGTAMLIHAGTHGETLIGRCLSIRPLVFVGLISYSLYLWHWPVVVFAQYYSVIALTPAAILLVLCVSLFLAVVSWRYVETPFRRKQLAAEPRHMFGVSAAAMFALVTVGVVGIYDVGDATQDSLNAGTNHERGGREWQRWEECEHRSRNFDGTNRLCAVGSEGGLPSFILWGDSHGMSLASAVDQSAALHDRAGELAVALGCAPLSGVVREGRQYCDEFNKEVLEYISARDEIQTVIMAARWAFLVGGDYDRREPSFAPGLLDLRATEQNGTDNTSILETGLRRTLARLQALGKDVVLVASVPEVGYDVPSAAYIAAKTNRDVNSLISPTVLEHEQRNAEVATVFARLSNTAAVHAIADPTEYLCDTRYCRVAIDNTPLYRDDNHLSIYGSRYLSRMFDDVFGQSSVTAGRPEVPEKDIAYDHVSTGTTPALSAKYREH